MKKIKRKTLSLIIFLTSLFMLSTLLCSPAVFAGAMKRNKIWVPTEGSYTVENSMLKLQSDSGYNSQGPETIVDGFNKMQAGNPDFIWYGEYEYISIDGGATWNQLPSVRTLTEVTAGEEYLISFDTSGTPLAGLDIDKRVAIVTGPDEPLARIEYSITSTQTIPSAMLYYAIDYCDYQTTGDATDNVYDFSDTQVLTSQWFTGIVGLYVDTLGSGFGVIETTYAADYYAGYWSDALYMTFDIGEDIDTEDDGIGVRIDLGELLDSVTVVKDLYIGVYQAGEPPEPVEDHDVEAVSQTVTENEVMPGDLVDIDVTVQNNGDFTETFDLTCYYDSVEIGTVTVVDLAPAEVRVVTFTWDTTGMPQNGYPIKAWADSGEAIVEVNEDNNWCTMPLNVFVVPELPLGTILAALSMFVSLIGYVGFKRYRTK